MREKIIKLYRFNELSDTAKEKAREWYRSGFEYFWGDDAVNSLKGFCEHFGIHLRDYAVDAFGPDNYVKADMPEYAEDIAGLRLWKYLQNQDLLTYWNKYHKKKEPLLNGDCPFTGYCMDESLLDPIREFMKSPPAGSDPDKVKTWEELIEDCFDSWLRAVKVDIEYSYSDEAVDENITINEYEFLEDGRRAA